MRISKAFRAICLALFINAVGGVSDLPRLNVDKNAISVSGISSGAAVATQMHVAFSSTFMGVGIIAGIPNMCTPALACMNSPSLINVPYLRGLTETAALWNNIDPTSDMKGDKVWVFAGTKDTVVNPGVGTKVVEYYKYFVANLNQIKFVNNLEAEHGQITNNYGGKCSELHRDNFMNNCNYSAAYNLLDHIYTNQIEPKPDYMATGDLYTFNQARYASPLALMDHTGYIYVPKACKNATKVCKLHVALHGCLMGRYRIGDTYVKNAGYNEVGDLNDIIVIYPQVVTSPLNPNGCWDWFAYTGPFYAVRQSFQMSAIHKMVKKVSGQMI